jgi:acetyl-CoA C-acetyltransferase
MSRERLTMGIKPSSACRCRDISPSGSITTPGAGYLKALKNADWRFPRWISRNQRGFRWFLLANNKLLELEGHNVNVYGGAVSANTRCAFRRAHRDHAAERDGERGRQNHATGICNGGGGASSIVLSASMN